MPRGKRTPNYAFKGATIHLGPSEARLWEALHERRGQFVDWLLLTGRVWPDERPLQNKAVYDLMCRLRSKIPGVVKTAPKLGDGWMVTSTEKRVQRLPGTPDPLYRGPAGA